jgi:hypothetical protein
MIKIFRVWIEQEWEFIWKRKSFIDWRHEKFVHSCFNLCYFLFIRSVAQRGRKSTRNWNKKRLIFPLLIENSFNCL